MMRLTAEPETTWNVGADGTIILRLDPDAFCGRAQRTRGSARVIGGLGISFGGDERVSPRRLVAIRRDDLRHPGRVVNSVQVFLAEISRHSDDGLATPKLRSQLLHCGQNRSGASPNEQMIISNEGKTGFDSLLLRHRHDSVRLGEIRKGGSYARPDAGDVSLCGRASERHGAYRFDGDNRDVREFLTKPLRDSG